MTSARRWRLVAMAAVAIATQHPAAAQIVAPAAATLEGSLAGRRLFPPNNWWNLDVSAAPIAAESSALIDFISGRSPTNPTAVRRLHPDFGPSPYGIPYVVVGAGQPLVPVSFVEYPEESDPGAAGRPDGYPVPAEAQTTPGYIEGAIAGGGSSGDRHMLIVDESRWLLFETYHTRWNASRGTWEAGSGAVFDLASNARRPEGWTSADAAGLPILPGLVRYDEVFGPDEITHAFRVTVRDTNGHVWPASHSAGTRDGAPPMGTRLRLKSAVDVSRFAPEVQKIFRAMKRYGLIVADNGSDMYITGTMDDRWNNDVLNPAFAALTADDFEVITLGWDPGVPAPPAANDYNGDGSGDLAIYRPASGTWYVDGGATSRWGAPSDIPVPADYTGDGRVDVAVFRPGTGTWYVAGASPVAWGAPGDVPVPADYTGDGHADFAVFRPATGTWYVRGVAAVAFGRPDDVPVPADFDGDGVADRAVYRAASGTWFVEGQSPVAFGSPGDLPVPCDYNGDGRAERAVFRPSTGEWIIQGLGTFTFGRAGDVPMPFDRTGDGRADLVVYRPATGEWFALDWLRGTSERHVFGTTGDRPAGAWPSLSRMPPGDVDGDRRSDLTVYRPAAGGWYSRLSATGTVQAGSLGVPGDRPIAGDFDGDGRLDRAVFRPSSGTWHVLFSSSGFSTGRVITWGASSDTPVAGDYDGDRRTDVATWTSATGTWRVRLSSTDYASGWTLAWGTSGDTPVPADYDGDGRTDCAVFRPTTGVWYVTGSASGRAPIVTTRWGQSGDRALAADYDGDGKADLAVYRPLGGGWYVWPSSGAAPVSWQWGAVGDTPVPADYDGDGKADPAVFRPSTGTWFVLGQFSTVLGVAGDLPVR